MIWPGTLYSEGHKANAEKVKNIKAELQRLERSCQRMCYCTLTRERHLGILKRALMGWRSARGGSPSPSSTAVIPRDQTSQRASYVESNCCSHAMTCNYQVNMLLHAFESLSTGMAGIKGLAGSKDRGRIFGGEFNEGGFKTGYWSKPWPMVRYFGAIGNISAKLSHPLTSDYFHELPREMTS